MSETDRLAHARQLRRQLGDFIRLHRERLTPESLGLPAGGRRRTPGLRREELAQRSLTSTTWITWLEQGREVAASAAMLARLAQALLLTTAERAYLFELAARPDPALDGAAPPGPVAAVLRCVQETGCPAYVLDRRWDVVAANARARELFLDWGAEALDGPPNLLRFLFLYPPAKTLVADWTDRSARLVAEFRGDCGRHGDEPSLQALVTGLCAASADFAGCWQSRAVLAREGGSRGFHHPSLGELRFEQLTLRPDVCRELKVVMLLADAMPR